VEVSVDVRVVCIGIVEVKKRDCNSEWEELVVVELINYHFLGLEV
jgi:hypothetical protein